MTKKILYIDMDGVLADYKSAYKKSLIENPSQIYPQSQYGFFIDLIPIEGAIESFNKLDKIFNVWILTRPSVHNLSCYTEKAHWVRKYLGFKTQEKLIISTNKALLKGDYLIDDQLVHGQSEFEGELIHFGNGEFKDWNSILNYLYQKEGS